MKSRTLITRSTRTKESHGALETWWQPIGALTLSVVTVGSLTFADTTSEEADIVRATLAAGITACQPDTDRPLPTGRSDMSVTANNQCLNVGMHSGSLRTRQAMHISVYLLTRQGVITGPFTEDFLTTAQRGFSTAFFAIPDCTVNIQEQDGVAKKAKINCTTPRRT